MKYNKLEKTNRLGVLLWGIVFAVIAVVAFVALMSGRRSTHRETASITKIESMSCEGGGIEYPVFSYDESDSKQMKIITTYEKNELRSISLQYKLFYADSKKISDSEANNHAAMNFAYGTDGFSADNFNATYATMKDNMRFSLYALREDMTKGAGKYFMLDESKDYKMDIIKEEYEKLGMKCTNNLQEENNEKDY